MHVRCSLQTFSTLTHARFSAAGMIAWGVAPVRVVVRRCSAPYARSHVASSRAPCAWLMSCTRTAATTAARHDGSASTPATGVSEGAGAGAGAGAGCGSGASSVAGDARKTVLIVGGGMSGLVAANRLMRQFRVRVVDESDRAGGLWHYTRTYLPFCQHRTCACDPPCLFSGHGAWCHVRVAAHQHSQRGDGASRTEVRPTTTVVHHSPRCPRVHLGVQTPHRGASSGWWFRDGHGPEHHRVTRCPRYSWGRRY